MRPILQTAQMRLILSTAEVRLILLTAEVRSILPTAEVRPILSTEMKKMVNFDEKTVSADPLHLQQLPSHGRSFSFSSVAWHGDV